jgi:hypothetical protein
MAFIDALEEYGIDEMEYGILIEDSNSEGETFRLYIPKLMTFFRNESQHQKWVFNNNIFLNDNECKPETNNHVNTQNFVTVRKYPLQHYPDADGIIRSGRRFIVHVMNKNIRDMRIIETR